MGNCECFGGSTAPSAPAVTAPVASSLPQAHVASEVTTPHVAPPPPPVCETKIQQLVQDGKIVQGSSIEIFSVRQKEWKAGEVCTISNDSMVIRFGALGAQSEKTLARAMWTSENLRMPTEDALKKAADEKADAEQKAAEAERKAAEEAARAAAQIGILSKMAAECERKEAEEAAAKAARPAPQVAQTVSRGSTATAPLTEIQRLVEEGKIVQDSKIEIFSQRHKVWKSGVVESISSDHMTIKFEVGSGQTNSKGLPRSLWNSDNLRVP